MRNSFIILLLLAGIFLMKVSPAQSESAACRILVYLKDKGPVAAAAQHPENYLSAAAIERRLLCNTTPDFLDIPVNHCYMELLGTNGNTIISSSKWLNAVLISCPAQNIHDILKLDIVDKIEIWNEVPASNKNTTGTSSIYNYGNAETQITMLQLDKLHDQGFTGNNILIAVFDGGFNSVNTLNAFQYLRSRNRIKATRDFVNEDGDVYADDAHGEEVFSILAAKQDGAIIGSGFDADFLLARTENVSSETHAEEYNWMRAAEWADSAGAKIIQSSLGYSDFDSGGNYSPADMDGKTTIITKAALTAMRKGIVVVNSAGNEGDKAFRKITAPSDADSILAVGSVNGAMNRVMNSGQGPSADGRIKPDVMAMGGNTAYYGVGNLVAFGTGTSFSSPLIAGLCACLMQKHKFITNIELINAVKRSADRFNNPDTLYGYGIPNAVMADTILQKISAGRGIINSGINEDPIIINTLAQEVLLLNIEFKNSLLAEIYNASGTCILKKEILTKSLDISALNAGFYYLKLNGFYAGKFIKQ